MNIFLWLWAFSKNLRYALWSIFMMTKMIQIGTRIGLTLCSFIFSVSKSGGLFFGVSVIFPKIVTTFGNMADSPESTTFGNASYLFIELWKLLFLHLDILNQTENGIFAEAVADYGCWCLPQQGKNGVGVPIDELDHACHEFQEFLSKLFSYFFFGNFFEKNLWIFVFEGKKTCLQCLSIDECNNEELSFSWHKHASRNFFIIYPPMG